MAFDPANLVVAVNSIGGGNLRMHFYKSDDDLSEITSAGYITRAASYGLRVGDLVFIAGFADPGSRSEVGFISAITAGNGTVEIQQDAYLNPFGLMTFGDPAEVDDWAERLAATAATNQTVTLPPGVYATSSVTIPSTATLVMMPGAVLRPASGATVTVNGKFSADPEQRIFDLSQGGTVFPAGNKEWSFIWFGAYNDGSNGAANATAKAGFDRAYALVPGGVYTGLFIPPGRYTNSGSKDYDDMFVLWKSQTTLYSESAGSCWMQFGVQLMNDDTNVKDITIRDVRYGLLFDDESDTVYRDDNPRYGEPVRSVSPAPTRAVRRRVENTTVFNCTYGAVALDVWPEITPVSLDIQNSTIYGWYEHRGPNTALDVGVVFINGGRIQNSGVSNIYVAKAGGFFCTGTHIYGSGTGYNIHLDIKDPSAPGSMGNEIARQVMFTGCSIENEGTRDIAITAVADGGGGKITLTLASTHYLSVGYFQCDILGTTSYNGTTFIVDSITSDTVVTLRKNSGSFTFTGTETGTLRLQQLDLVLESAVANRILRTSVIGGDLNSLVAVNVSSLFMSAVGPKESCYIRTSRDVTGIGPYNFVRTPWSSDTPFLTTYAPWNVDTATKWFRQGYGDDYDDDGYYMMTAGGSRLRIYNANSGASNLVEVANDAAVARLALYRQHAHGVAEVGNLFFAGRDSAGNRQDYAAIRSNATDDTSGSEDGTLRLSTVVAGTLSDRFTVANGMYSAGASGSDPGAGSINIANTYRVNGTIVLGARRTGWTAASGTATRTTFATGSVTTADLAERVKALIDDLIAHGVIGT